MGFSIIGTGKSVPGHVVTNEMLSRFLETNDEWISSRTGIKNRNVITDETLLGLASEAAEAAVSDAGISVADIDMIVVSTLQGDFVSPALSCLVAQKIGSSADKVFDINMGCCGFVFALDLADTYLSAGKAECVLVVCAESLSKLVDWTDRSTCVLFGDGAGAVVLKKSDNKAEIITKIEGGYENLYIPGRMGNSPYAVKKDGSEYLAMNGREIFKFAVSSIVEDIGTVLENNSLSCEDVSYFLLHQANLRIINFSRQRLGQPEEKFPHNVENYGNTSSASIPILLDDLNKQGMLKKDDLIVFSAFGAGLARGTCLIKWGR
ncbi:MAG: ketoacyl-ACP synthase III [Clostridia bacterium]|nr:ketoacyl-ACP synthase III [Clostridia bacterium]